MRFHIYSILLLITITVNASDLGTKIASYFDDSRVKSLREIWNRQRKPFENAVASMLKRAYSLNVYVNSPYGPQNIIGGYLMEDNIVKVLLVDVTLREPAVMLLPEVSFPLDHNVIRVESTIGKIFIDASYILYRNTSQIVYNALEDPYKHSPFSYQQVQKEGFVTIIGEGCHMITQSIVNMVGVSLRIGATTVKVTKCHFSVEIFSPGLSAPPIIAPYFSPQQSKDLQKLLANSQLEEMAARLQGTMTSIVNITAILGLNMPNHRRRQRNILKATTDYMALVARKMNILTSRSNKDIVPLDDVLIKVDAAAAVPDGFSKISITEMTINGLDTVYSSRQGGPCMMSSMRVIEVFRYSRLQIRGALSFMNSTDKGHYKFSGEITDVGVYITLNVAQARRSLRRDASVNNEGNDEEVEENDNVQENLSAPSDYKFGFRGWRQIKISISDILDLELHEKFVKMITGVLHNMVPTILMKHFEEVFNDAVTGAKEDDGYIKQFRDQASKEKSINEVNDSDDKDDEYASENERNDESKIAEYEEYKKRYMSEETIYIPGRSNKRSENKTKLQGKRNKL